MKKVSLLGISAILGMMALGGDVNASIVSRGFLDNALTDYVKTTALDLKANQSDLTDLSNKIGNAWPYMFNMSPGLHTLSWGLYPLKINLENTSDLVSFLFGNGGIQNGVLNFLAESVYNRGAYDVNTGQIDDGFRSLLQLTDGWTDSKKRTYLGVKGLNDAIGTLPSGSLQELSPSVAHLIIGKIQSTRDPIYPNSMAELIKQIYGDVSRSQPGLIPVLVDGYPNGGSVPHIPSELIGIIPAMEIAHSNTVRIEANTVRIGELPTGDMPGTPVWSDMLLPYSGFEPIYPTSLAELMELLFGNFEKNRVGILQYMAAGFPVNDGTDNLIGIYPNYLHAIDANELATTANTTANTANETANAAKSADDANTAKIGTLPTEYATVGAALTAIKGIAEEAKAAALAAIPDPKKEGATGKYVLTVDIIGDNATYRWEKIDRFATESSTTE